MLTIHVLTSVGWFGIAVAVVFCWIAASVTADKALSSALYSVLGIAPWLSVTAGIAAAVTGAILGLSSQFGLIRYWWVLIKVIITVVVVVVDATLVAAFARHAAATGHGAPALYGSTSAHVVVLVIATVLSVFKPRGLTPWGRARIPARRRSPGGRGSTNIPFTADQSSAEE